VTVPVTRVDWKNTCRLIPSRFPPVGLFDRVADPADLDAVYALEGLTNERLRQEAGDVSLVRDADRRTGPGTTPIMAAFTHMNPDGSRFSDGTYGVYYTARDLDTAIAECAYHSARFLMATHEGPISLDMRLYLSDVSADLHDIRGMREERPDLYDPDSYAASQSFARPLWANDAYGICYGSVRRPVGECAAVFRPPALSPVTQSEHWSFDWDSRKFSSIHRKSGH
jgi:RES domain